MFAAADTLDNGAFLENTIKWLDVSDEGAVYFTTGHREWVTAYDFSPLANRMADDGYSFTAIRGKVSPAALDSASVLIIGNAWGDFTTEEIAAVRQFVENGGGLCLLGLGWSWEPYNQEHGGLEFSTTARSIQVDIRSANG